MPRRPRIIANRSPVVAAATTAAITPAPEPAHEDPVELNEYDVDTFVNNIADFEDGGEYDTDPAVEAPPPTPTPAVKPPAKSAVVVKTTVKTPAPKAPAPVPASAKKSTRGPGRPRKVDTSNVLTLDGVLSEPADAGDLVEMVCQNPFQLRKIITMLRAFEVSSCTISFTSAGVSIRTVCKLRKNHIYVDINGCGLIAYYCGEPLHAVVQVSALNDALGGVVRTHNKTTFIIKRAMRDTLYIVNEDTTSGIMGRHTVRLATALDAPVHTAAAAAETPADVDAPVSASVNAVAFSETVDDHPVVFQYQAAALKRVTTTNARGAPTIEFTIMGNGDITMSMPTGNDTGATFVLNHDKFGVSSQLDADDFANASVYVNSVKRFADNSVGENISIYFGCGMNTCLESIASKCIRVRVFLQS